MIDASGGTEWITSLKDRISALTHTGDGVVAGTQAGDIVRIDASGNETWRHRCGFLPERTFWPWWFMRTPAIGALAMGHDQREHRSIVAAGTGSTNLVFLDACSGRILSDKLSPYGFPDRIKACYDGPDMDLGFLVGHSWLTSGSVVRRWTPPFDGTPNLKYFESVDAMGRTQDEWDTCGVVDFWQGVLALRHSVNTLVLRHGAVNQLTLYETDSGVPIWDAGIGGAPTALTVVAGDDLISTRIHVSEEFGWLVTFDGYGTRICGSRPLPDILGMHLSSEDRLLVWNDKALLASKGEQEFSTFYHGGKALAWHESRLSSGLLCVRDRQLRLMAVNDEPGTPL
ncbi:MAG: hypothetical protein HOH43_08695 [Candidatus Latescibacteria bacterium]|nr:hypothetical protein [Candidatus Latescibacterota bacterium]